MSARAVKTEDLGHMTENDLYNLFRKLDSYLERLGRVWWNSKDENLKKEAKNVEEDLCYVIRELKHRKTRSRCHREFLKERSSY